MKTEVGVETLKDHLGDYLRRARKGETIVITEHGRSVALLISLEGNDTAGRAWDLVETGAANWTGGKPAGSSRRPRARGKSASATVQEDRR
jgi:prevent-host-death family protein